MHLFTNEKENDQFLHLILDVCSLYLPWLYNSIEVIYQYKTADNRTSISNHIEWHSIDVTKQQYKWCIKAHFDCHIYIFKLSINYS